MPLPALALPRPVALVGMPGAGKSTVGALLARVLQQVFVDMDAEIESRSRLSISDIFTARGEAVFRRYERCTARRLVRRYPGAVIATGGGAFAEERTRLFLLAHTLTVWLEAPLSQLRQRLRRDTCRPLLAGGDIPAKLAALMETRRPAYAQALIRVPTAADPAAVVEHLLKELAAHGH